MIIKRILTHNAVIVEVDGQEKIVCGKGIGFNKKRGMLVDETMINQTFVLEDNTKARFEDLIKDVPIEYVDIANYIIQEAKLELAKSFPDTIILSLADHIYAAIQRIKEGLSIHNSLLWDIKNFYDIEYGIGLKGIKRIQQQLNIELPEDEAGFIALHIVNAQLDDKHMNQAYQVTQAIKEITSIIRRFYSMTFDTSDIYYYRFITHLKFFALRLFKNQQYIEEPNELTEIIKEKFKLAYQCVNKISQFLIMKYNYNLSEEEKLYLTIHIHRVVSKSKHNH